MDDGFRLAGAYIDVDLKDNTQRQLDEIKARIAKASGDVNVGVNTDRAIADLAALEALIAEREAQMKVGAKADQTSAKAAGTEVARLAGAKSGDVKVKASADTASAEKAGEEVATAADRGAGSQNNNMSLRGRLIAAAIAGGIGAGSALLTGATVLAMTGAVVAGAAAIEKNNPLVRGAWEDLVSTSQSTLQQGFSGLTPILAGTLNQWSVDIKALEPQIARLGTAAIPAIQQLSSAVADFTKTSLQGMTVAMATSGPVVTALAGGIRTLGDDFSQMINGLDFHAAAAGIQALFTGIGSLLPVIGNVVDAFAPLGTAILAALVPIGQVISQLVGTMAPAIAVVANAVGFLGQAIGALSGPITTVALLGAAFLTVNKAVSMVNSVVTAAKSAWSSYDAAVNKALGSVDLQTSASQKQAIAIAASEVAAKKEAATQATATVAKLEAAKASDGMAVSEAALVEARSVATAATAAETEANVALAAAERTATVAAGPLGIILAVVGGALALVAGNAIQSAANTGHMSDELTKLQQAAAGGSKALTDLFKQDPNAKQTLSTLKQYGVSMSDLTAAANGSVPALQKIVNATGQAVTAQKAKIAADDAAIQSYYKLNQSTGDAMSRAAGEKGNLQALTDQRNKDKAALDNLSQGQKDAIANLQAAKAAQDANAASLASNGQTQAMVANVARGLGLSVGQVGAAFVSAQGAIASWDMGPAIQGLLGVQSAEQQVQQSFKQADQAVVQAQQGLASANYSYQQSIQAVADAQHGVQVADQAVVDANHGVMIAERGVQDALYARGQAAQQVQQSMIGIRDAESGVVVAENTLSKAQLSERDAQLALTAARKAAQQQLISLRLQLQDQVASEEQSRLSLFDQQKASAALGITMANAKQIMAQPITSADEARVKSALALVQAQNSLNDTYNTGKNLRDQVNTANKAGINGSTQVISATKALVTAQDQVISAERGLVKAHEAVTTAQQQLANSQHSLVKASQGVSDAQYAVGKAQQAVGTASYALQKAHQAVATAQHAEQQAAQQLATAQKTLTTATDAASRSFDLNTAAGVRNMTGIMNIRKAVLGTNPTLKDYTNFINDVATAFGWTDTQAYNFLKQQGLIPPGMQDPTKAMQAQAKAAHDLAVGIDEVSRAMPAMQAANKKMYDYQAAHPLKGLGTYFGGPSKAGGGLLSGPGSGTSDSIVAHVSNGEYVVKASSVNKYGVNFLNAVNAGAFANGGQVSVPTASAIPSPSVGLSTQAPSTGSGDAASQLYMLTDLLTRFIAIATAGTSSDQTFSSSITGNLTPALHENTTATNLTVDSHQRLLNAQEPLRASIDDTSNRVQKDWDELRSNMVANSNTVQSRQTGLQDTTAASWNAVRANMTANADSVQIRQTNLQNQMQTSWSNISAVTATSVNHQNGSLTALNGGLDNSQSRIGAFEKAARSAFNNLYTDTANPIHSIINGPIDKGIIAAWNSLNQQFSLGKKVGPVPGFAVGGRVTGPGGPKDDQVPALLSNGEFVVKESIARQAMPFLHALNDGQPEAVQATGGPSATLNGYANGGLVADTGSQMNAAIARGMGAINTMKGKPYVWGGAGIDGADCSGLVAIITNALRGESNIFHRIGVAQDQPWPGFVSGLHSAFGTGFNSHHTASTLNGVNSEARDFGIPILVGAQAAGATSPEFTGHASLPVVGGKFIGGGGSGFDANAIVSSAFASTGKMIDRVKTAFPGNIAAFDGAGMASNASKAVQAKAVEALAAFGGGGIGGVPPAHGNALAAQNYAKGALASFGWGPDQFGPLLQLWQKESSWDANIVNPNGGAYGIPQALPAVWGHPYAMGDYANQIMWGLNYIKNRPDERNPAGALAHEFAYGWYDHGGKSNVQTGGGKLPPGVTLGALANGTGKTETIRTAAEEDALGQKLDRIAALLEQSNSRPVVNQTVNAAGTLDEVATTAARIVSQQLQGAF